LEMVDQRKDDDLVIDLEVFLDVLHVQVFELWSFKQNIVIIQFVEFDGFGLEMLLEFFDLLLFLRFFFRGSVDDKLGSIEGLILGSHTENTSKFDIKLSEKLGLIEAHKRLIISVVVELDITVFNFQCDKDLNIIFEEFFGFFKELVVVLMDTLLEGGEFFIENFIVKEIQSGSP